MTTSTKIDNSINYTDFKPFELDESNLAPSKTFVFDDNEGNELTVYVDDSMICISHNRYSWFLVDEIKKDFEKTINPSSQFKAFLKSYLHSFFNSLARYFK